MPKVLKPIRRPALTACLKKHKFDKADWVEPGEFGYELRGDVNTFIRIEADEITVDIVTYKKFSMVPTETPVEEIVAYIDSEMAKRSESRALFDNLRAQVLHNAKQLGVNGFWKIDDVDQHAFNFYTNAYRAEPLFYLSYTGPTNKTVMALNFTDHEVETADEVIAILQGDRAEYWPAFDERIVFNGKSIFTFKTFEDFVPFMFTHGVTSIIERVDTVQLSSKNPALHSLVVDHPEPKHYLEIRLRRAITAEEFFDYIKKKTADLKLSGQGEFA
jgi:hypothetical protein